MIRMKVKPQKNSFIEESGKSRLETIIVVVIIIIAVVIVSPLIFQKIKESVKSVDVTNAKYLHEIVFMVKQSSDDLLIESAKIDIYNKELLDVSYKKPQGDMKIFIDRIVDKYPKSVPKMWTNLGMHFIVYLQTDGNIKILDENGLEIFPNTHKDYK